MRTTLDIEDDVLAAARELARRQGTTAVEEACAATLAGECRDPVTSRLTFPE